MKSDALTDDQWAVIAPLLPPPKTMGRPRADDRRTLNAILFVLRSGCRWKDVPSEFGSGVTAWRRLKAWEEAGVWERVWRALLSSLDAQDKLEWAQVRVGASVSGRFVRSC